MQESRDQTHESFSQKWTNGSNAFVATTLDENSDIFLWITNRNGFRTASEFSSWLTPRRRILDAGCGNGRVTRLLRRYCPVDAEVIGVDYASHQIAESNLAGISNTTFAHADLTGDLAFLGKFDLIYCQEVLHHTQDPRQSFLNLVKLLESQGEIAIYVYKKKAIIREFSDDFIREKIQNLNFEDAKSVISQITNFAKNVSQMKEVFSFPAIPILGIESSELSIHRFIYNNLFKNFWNDQLTYEENFLVNFDWYHPSTSSRHTKPEVLGWFTEASLSVIHSCEDDFGITVRGVKP